MTTTTTNTANNTDPGTGEPRLAAVASWAVLFASFALSASTWIAMAVLAGFTDTATLPYIDVTLRVAWLMPVAVDGYVVVALVLWMSPVPASVAEFAKKNTYGAAGIGIVAQSAYHLLETHSATDQTWRVVLAALVGALPPAVAGLAVHMRALIRREGSTPNTVNTAATASTTATATVSPSPVTMTIPVLSAAATGITGPPHTAPVSVTTDESESDPARREVPTPAHVAARVTPSPTTIPLRSTATRPTAAGTSKPRPRKPEPTAPADLLAAPATDIVTVPEPAQLALPLPVAPSLLGRAENVARQYRTEHGTPITAGQLAARLRVNSEQAAQALAVLDLGPNTPTTALPTVNGSSVKATR